MSNKKAINILKKNYHHTNSDYETDYFGEIGYKTDFLTEEQHSILKQANLVPNNFQKLTHDALLKGFLEIKNSGKLSLDSSTSLFIKGLSGKFPRYRQTLMSVWYLCGIDNHKFEKSELKENCSICGLPKNTFEDRTHSLFTYYLGHSWNEMPAHFLGELQEISEMPKPRILEDEIEVFINLLKEINKADANETPGQLEKRIAKSKLLPKTNKYKRYGILQTLAVIGVLPSNSEFDNQPIRSDIVLPLAGWQVELGVDFNKVTEIFKIKAPNNV